MPFQVLDNGKSADCHGFPVHPSWNKSLYDTFDEALKYAWKWLGDKTGGPLLKVNTPWEYSGYGDTIEIREIVDPFVVRRSDVPISHIVGSQERIAENARKVQKEEM